MKIKGIKTKQEAKSFLKDQKKKEKDMEKFFKTYIGKMTYDQAVQHLNMFSGKLKQLKKKFKIKDKDLA